MFRKKLLVLVGTAAAMTAASVAYADYYDSYGRYVYERPVVVERYRTYSSPPVYYSAPATTYYYEPAPTYYSAPAPSYYYAPSGTATGAIAGALIGGSLADRHHRGEAALAGALVGGAIGSTYDRPYMYSY